MQKGANPQYLEPVLKSSIAQLHASKVSLCRAVLPTASFHLRELFILHLRYSLLSQRWLFVLARTVPAQLGTEPSHN
jgi:hypothetical protein